MKVIRTRFAPSPTGFLHIGGARTALFAWAFARKQHGEFILRIEDTDTNRSTQESVNSIIDAMHWLNLEYDNKEIYYQSKRINRYKQVIQTLLDSGHAYYCYCSKEDLEVMRNDQMQSGVKPKYNRHCLNNAHVDSTRSPVIRFRNPDDGCVTWNDLIKGTISINNSELDDLIIARSDGMPTYNLCVVVDDFDMAITHVIRGDDHVNNTPRQINILKALGANIPEYAHIPMILNGNGLKMSKRRDAVSVMDYKEMGILPNALINYLARLCWGHEDHEVFSVKEFIDWFTLGAISSAPARFDIKKLLWVNKEHIKSLSSDQLSSLVLDIWVEDFLAYKAYQSLHESILLDKVIDLFRSRSDNIKSLALECSYVYAPMQVDTEDINKHLTNHANIILKKFADALDKVPVNTWNTECLSHIIHSFCVDEDIKMPELGMPARLKLCGTTKAPSLDGLLYVIGKHNSLTRLRK